MTETGTGPQPFFAMEYVQGLSLTEYAKTHHLGTRDRIELFFKVCEAVEHAHQKGVIHRDLKPANILVVHDAVEPPGDEGERGTTAVAVPATIRRTVPQPKILDFGIARVTDADIASTTVHTDIGQLIGTVAYMSAGD